MWRPCVRASSSPPVAAPDKPNALCPARRGKALPVGTNRPLPMHRGLPQQVHVHHPAQHCRSGVHRFPMGILPGHAGCRVCFGASHLPHNPASSFIHHANLSWQACVNVSPGARAVCVAMQRFLDTSPPEMFVKTDERRQYCWKQVVVRTSVHQPDVMVFITARNSRTYSGGR